MVCVPQNLVTAKYETREPHFEASHAFFFVSLCSTTESISGCNMLYPLGQVQVPKGLCF